MILAAGMKGIEEGYELPPEATNNIFEMSPAQRRKAGIRSLPVRLGATRAAVVLCVVMLGAQIAATSAVFAWGARGWALATVPLLVAQLPLMLRFAADPVRRALWLSAVGVPLFVLGMLGSALGARSLVGGGA